MPNNTGIVVALIPTGLSALGFLFYYFIYQPVKRQAKKADQRSRENKDDIEEIERVLLGGDHTDGLVFELQSAVTEMRQETKRQSQMQTEMMHQWRQVAEALNESELDVEMDTPDRDPSNYYGSGGVTIDHDSDPDGETNTD